MLSWRRHVENLGSVILGVLLTGAQLVGGANGVIPHLWLDAAVALILLASMALARSRDSLTGDPLIWTLGALFAASVAIGALSLFIPIADGAWAPSTVDGQATLLELLHLGGVACTFLAARLVCRNVAGAEIFGRVLTAGFAVVALTAVARHAVGSEGRESVDGLRRLWAGFSSPNSAAALFGMGMVWSATLLVQSRRLHRRSGDRTNVVLSLGWLALGACSVALLLTLSRTGLAAAAASVAILVAYTLARRPTRTGSGVRDQASERRRALAVVVPLLFGAGILPAILNEAVQRRLSTAAFDWTGRAEIYQVHLHRWLEQPLFGYGLGVFDVGNTDALRPDSYMALWSVRAAHDLALQWLVTGGVVQATLMGAAMALTLRAAWVGMRREAQPWSGAVFFAAVFVLLHGVLDYGLEEPSIAMLFAAALGLAAAVRPNRAPALRAARLARPGDTSQRRFPLVPMVS